MENKVIKEYDENNNLIHYKDALGFENWYKYDENNRIINSKDSKGYEEWYKRIDKHILLIITQQEFKQIERKKLYLNNKKCSRFELMDI